MADCRRFRVTGLVQGVWFRESTRQQAQLLAITGYARNCPDGSVEVLACGAHEAIRKLREWLDTGPELARVEHVEELAANDPCPEGFVTG